MSDIISTATNTINTSLSMNMSEFEMAKCTLYNMKILGYVILTIVLFCILSSMTAPKVNYVKIPMEQFSNDELYSYKRINNVTYARAELVSPINTLIGGSAMRYVTSNSIRYEINVNLPLLNGNVFGPRKEQSYIVVLSDDTTQKTFEIGTLINRGDQVYNLVTNHKLDKLPFERINIIHKSSDKTELLLTGLLL